MDKDVIDKKVKNILALVGLEGFEKRDVTRLQVDSSKELP